MADPPMHHSVMYGFPDHRSDNAVHSAILSTSETAVWNEDTDSMAYKKGIPLLLLHKARYRQILQIRMFLLLQ